VALSLQYAYTKSRQLQAMTYPDGTVADYVRNAQGQITSVGVTRPGQVREILLHQAAYHPFGPIAGWVYGNGRSMQRNVDMDYRPTSIQGGAGGLDLTYGYDAVGNLTSLASGSPPPIEYGYDALGRLTETRDAPTQAIIDQYAYDKTGNRTSYTDSLGTKAYAYPSTSHRLSSVAGESRTYDATGNTLSIGTAREFDYNDAGRMSQVRNGGVPAMQYAYNGRGEQVRKHLGPSEAQVLYDETGHWLGDYGTSGAVSQQAIWMDDMPVGVLDGGQLYYIQPDHLGTPRIVVDPVRNVSVWTWDLKGEAFASTPPEQDADGDTTQFHFHLRFPGQRYDTVSGLHQNGFRDYEPRSGRYLRSDPIGLGGGPSTFAYANNTPTGAFDPNGLKAIRVPQYGPGESRPDGTIYCQDGVVTPYVNWNRIPDYAEPCIGDCVVLHENSHVADANKSNSGVCKYWGWVPFLHPVGAVTFDTQTELFATELRAYAAELRCLSTKLAVNQCVSDNCRKVIEQRIDSIINVLLPRVYNGTYWDD
jgi:RHS repeat-associated protein